MSKQDSVEPMLDMFIFETTQLIEQLEACILSCENSGRYTQADINEVFRIMHTIKGSSAMMMFEGISSLCHAIEEIFYFLREENPKNVDCSALSDLVLEGIDYIKGEVEKKKNGDNTDNMALTLIDKIKDFLAVIKKNNTSASLNKASEHGFINDQKHNMDNKKNGNNNVNFFKAVIHFENGCEMENIRAFSVIHNLNGISDEVFYIPENIDDSEESVEIIRQKGFKVYIKADCSYENLLDLLMQTTFLKDLELVQLENDNEFRQVTKAKQINSHNTSEGQPFSNQSRDDKNTDVNNVQPTATKQSIISVSLSKLDTLMDLVGEMVIAEAMVIQNPDLDGLELNNFHKAARQLHKITGEMQDIVMSIRMVPVAATFMKMHRIVRDMGKKLGKEVQLKLIGENTEVDKNIIERISDPLMHLIRNAIDHGIEPREERQALGKPNTGTVTLEARNAGSDVLIIVRDDGKGLNKEKILTRAIEHGLISKSENEMRDQEIYNLILLPGFSTKDDVSEYSGRGVGMDVVTKNIEAISGSVFVDSNEGTGCTVTIKIPLTLAIIDGMNIKVGNACYTIPTISIKESFRPKSSDIIKDPDNNEMIMIRGQCWPILRLHEHYGVETAITDLSEGILIMVEAKEKAVCVFADELLGQQQVVVKTLPNYIKNMRKIRGITGCTLLRDGSISLILDVGELV